MARLKRSVLYRRRSRLRRALKTAFRRREYGTPGISRAWALFHPVWTRFGSPLNGKGGDS